MGTVGLANRLKGETTMSERLSGPCSHGDHHYCLGPHMILPCNCPCHATEHEDPEPEGTLNQTGFSIDPH